MPVFEILVLSSVFTLYFFRLNFLNKYNCRVKKLTPFTLPRALLIYLESQFLSTSQLKISEDLKDGENVCVRIFQSAYILNKYSFGFKN